MLINRIKSRTDDGRTLSYTVKYRWTGLLEGTVQYFWKTEPAERGQISGHQIFPSPNKVLCYREWIEIGCL